MKIKIFWNATLCKLVRVTNIQIVHAVFIYRAKLSKRRDGLLDPEDEALHSL
jgi:hypothetical protein